MALILGIETATEICSVSLGKDGICISELNNLEKNSHASQLHVMVENLLKETGYSLKDLNAIAVSKGPGSYTGLRVGVSAAKGFAYALGIPVISLNSLKSLCNRLLVQTGKKDALYVPMIDARRMEVYTAIYSSNLDELEPVSARIIDSESYRELLTDNKLVFFGNGSEKCIQTIQHPNAWFLENFSCGASGLIEPAEQTYQRGEFENLAYFEPYYLKDFVGIPPKIKK